MNTQTQPPGARASTRSVPSQSPGEFCSTELPRDPCSIIILGATGDLTARKLLPALYDLFRLDFLPDPFLIVGCGRTSWDDETFRHRMRAAVENKGPLDGRKWERFASRLFYQPVDYRLPESFARLAHALRELDRRHGTGGNRIFYVALPPGLYLPVASGIGAAGLAAERENGNGWIRFVVEKPFGRDLASAEALDRGLHVHFKERQIFRIDHYLAKETVQNVLVFRFANAIFEPIWNRRYIDHVVITAAETLGVEHRAGYYEQAGVLRDMFQNHMMQLLALTAMEPPSIFEPDRVRDERGKVFRSLRPFDIGSLDRHLVLGQYAAGGLAGRPVPGYRQEPGVAPDSVVPTFAMMKTYVENWRWQGVPFYLASGKRLARKITEIAIQFKAVPLSMFRHSLGAHIPPNRLTLSVYPEERITLTFQTKDPGARVCLRSVTMDFNYQQNGHGPVLDAYEKVLLDCMTGDQMLFWRQDGVEACWAYLTPILERCEACGDRGNGLHFYAAGSWGPEVLQDLLSERSVHTNQIPWGTPQRKDIP